MVRYLPFLLLLALFELFAAISPLASTAPQGKRPASACLSTALYERLLVDSPSQYTRVIELGQALSPGRLTAAESKELAPVLTGKNLYGETISLSVKSKAEFDSLEKQLRKKGFWLIFNPSGERKGFKVGHVSLLVDGTLFSRNIFDEGPASITMVPWEQRMSNSLLKGMLQRSYTVTQFFEVDESTLKLLKDFSVKRAQDQQEGRLNASLLYKFRPYSKYRDLPNVENCTTFCFSWSHPAFLSINPQLTQVGQQIGEMRVAEMPNVQIAYNALASGHRGTLLVTDKPEQMTRKLRSSRVRTDEMLHQLLFKAALKPIQQNP